MTPRYTVRITTEYGEASKYRVYDTKEQKYASREFTELFKAMEHHENMTAWLLKDSEYILRRQG